MNIDVFISRYPILYHMAENGSWSTIKQHGLLSTVAVLDRYGISGQQRELLEKQHRPEKITVGPPGDQIVLRDQKPMHPIRLARALVDGTTPSQWYRHLNGRVFMWAEEKRLFSLLNARAYRALTHDVLSIRTASLVDRYKGSISLAGMNSGNTFPMPFPRGLGLFKSIEEYPAHPRTNRPIPEVVEVVVSYHIPDIRDHVVEVRSIRGKETLGKIPL